MPLLDGLGHCFHKLAASYYRYLTLVSGAKCLPASDFNPSNLSTDQWVETAVAFGAKEICLTAHHEVVVQPC